MKIKEIKFIYVNQALLTISNETLKAAVRFVLENKTIPFVEPLSVVFPSTGKQLYFDRNLFEAFVNDTITQEELIKETTVIGIYRNTVEVQSVTKEIIEPDSLWIVKDTSLILIDDDRYVESQLCPNKFEKII